MHIASDLVRREDFSKITAILDRVAEGQDQLTESQQRLTEGQERLAAALEQLSWTVSDVKKHLGGLGQTAGYADEAYVLERLPKLLSRRFGFIETSAMPETFTHPDGSTDEIDVTVRGTIDGRPVAFIGETKTNITLECACMLAVQAAELVVRQAESLGGPPLLVAALGQGPLQHLDFEPGQPYAPCNTVSTATSARRTSEFDPGCTPGCVTRLASKPSPSRRGSGERIARSMALPQRSSGR